MTGVDADLATLRRRITNYASISQDHEGFAALARVEAELSRLREQRDAALHQRGVGTEWAAELAGKLHAARDERDEWEAKALDRLRRAEAAEAMCARLQQALAMLWQHYLLPISDEQKRQVEEALAGPDTPADRIPKFIGRLPHVPADSHEPREGIVMVYDWQHRYLGCMGVERWQEVLAADSPLCPCGHSADHHPAVWSIAGDATTACQVEGCGCDDYDGPPVPADSTEDGNPCDPMGEYPECGRGSCPTCTPADSREDKT